MVVDAIGRNFEWHVMLKHNLHEFFNGQLRIWQLGEHLCVTFHLRYRSQAVFPTFEFVGRHLECAEFFLVVADHVPESADLAAGADAALEARGDFGVMEDDAEVAHIVAPVADGLFEAVYRGVFALFE